MPASGVFNRRLQRPPPMEWDLDYEPSDNEEMSPVSEGTDSASTSCYDGTVSIHSPDMLSDAPVGFELTYDRAFHASHGDASGEAEQMAFCLLRLGRATEKQLQHHFSLLPFKPHLRNNSFSSNDVASTAASLSFGAFVHGGLFGCHKCTSTHPWSCLLWTSIVRSVMPLHKFTSVALARDTVSTLHSDTNNHKDSENLLISICTQSCRGGSLWVQDDSGDSVQAGAGRGVVHHLSAEGVLFNPRRPHFSFEFSGIRLVAVAYHIRDSWKLSSVDTRRILDLGFSPLDINPELSDPYLMPGA